jgi:hypothetical protein
MTDPTPGAPGDGRSARGRVGLIAAAVLLLVFVAGMGAGWGASRQTCRPPRRGQHRPAVASWLCGRRGGGGDPFARLGLSSAERARVDSVIKRRQPQIEAFWKGPGQQLRAILDSMHADVRAAIDPQHRAAFDSLPRPGRRGPGDDRR